MFYTYKYHISFLGSGRADEYIKGRITSTGETIVFNDSGHKIIACYPAKTTIVKIVEENA